MVSVDHHNTFLSPLCFSKYVSLQRLNTFQKSNNTLIEMASDYPLWQDKQPLKGWVASRLQVCLLFVDVSGGVFVNLKGSFCDFFTWWESHTNVWFHINHMTPQEYSSFNCQKYITTFWGRLNTISYSAIYTASDDNKLRCVIETYMDMEDNGYGEIFLLFWFGFLVTLWNRSLSWSFNIWSFIVI